MQINVGRGKFVKVVDEYGKEHDGLVTENWSSTSSPLWDTDTFAPCLNVVYVTDEEGKRDPYGQQIERLSSCSHRTQTTAPGRYWYHPDEPKKA